MAKISEGTSGKGRYWDVRWREAGRQRRRRFYRSEYRKPTVEKFLDQVRVVERLGPEARRGDVTVGSFADETWWPMTKERVRPNTRARFDVVRRNYLPTSLRSRAISDVRRGELIKLVADVVSSGKVESAKTLRTVLRLIWKDALDWELVESNIAAGRPIRVPDRDVDDVAVDRDSVLSVGDVRRIADGIDSHFRLAVLVMGHMGLRLGEIAALRRQDVDLVAGKLSVRRTATTASKAHLGGGERGQAGPPKTRSGVRTLEIPAPMLPLFGAHLATLKGDRLFTMKAGGKFEPANFRNRYFKPTVDSLDLAGTVPHDLRHSAASVMLEGGMSAAAVARYLGHANPQVTMIIYAHWFEDSTSAAAETIGRAIEGGAEEAEEAAEE